MSWVLSAISQLCAGEKLGNFPLIRLLYLQWTHSSSNLYPCNLQSLPETFLSQSQMVLSRSTMAWNAPKSSDNCIFFLTYNFLYTAIPSTEQVVVIPNEAYASVLLNWAGTTDVVLNDDDCPPVKLILKWTNDIVVNIYFYFGQSTDVTVLLLD